MNDHTTDESSQETPYGYCHCGCGQKTKIAQVSNSRYGWIKGEPMRFVHGHNGRVRPREKTFWARVNKPGPDACWEWQGGKTQDGYGKAGYKGKNALAHRLAWELTNGPIPDGLQVLHRCDNPPCCNPTHLFLGTHTDNMQDMFAKQRKIARGSNSANAKLTESQVREIRKRYAMGGVLQKDLATEYQVTPTTISFLLKRKTWTHIP